MYEENDNLGVHKNASVMSAVRKLSTVRKQSTVDDSNYETDRKRSSIPEFRQPHRGSTIGKSVRNVVGKAIKRTSSLRGVSEEHGEPEEFFSVFNTDKTTRRLTVMHEAPAEEKVSRVAFIHFYEIIFQRFC